MKKLIPFVAFATFLLLMTPVALANVIDSMDSLSNAFDMGSDSSTGSGPDPVAFMGPLGAVVLIVLLVAFALVGGCLIKSSCNGGGGAGGGTNMGGMNCLNACYESGQYADCEAHCGL